MGSYHVLAQQLDELDLLHAEATTVRARITCEAIERVKSALEVGLRPLGDDVRIVQEFVGKQMQQNRYGQ